jgi:hypothetical protein
VLRDVRHPQPFPDHFPVEWVAAQDQILDPGQDQILVDHVQAFSVPVGATAKVMARHAVVGVNGQDRLPQLHFRQRLRVASVPAVGVLASEQDPIDAEGFQERSDEQRSASATEVIKRLEGLRAAQDGAGPLPLA